jgi:DNA-binding MarR family transcriptional regulator
MRKADVRALQILYPQVYIACHTQHTRSRSTAYRLSSHDSALLVHLDERWPTRPADLARHLGVGAPTLSAALRRLETLGYLVRTRSPKDGRAIELRLSTRGADAMRATSVLEESRVRVLLGMLSTEERATALAGLGLLARAARAMGKRRWAETASR